MVMRIACLIIACAAVALAADPALAIDSGTTTYQVGDAAILLDDAATCSDADSPTSFDGGRVTVAVLNVVDASSNPLVPDASDVISVTPGDYTIAAAVWRISLSGALVRIAPVVSGVAGTPETIGAWSGGAGGASLTIDLTREATLVATTALLRSLAFKNESGASAVIGTRTIGITLSDGTAGTNAASDTTRVRVVAPPQAPTASNVTASTIEEQVVSGTLAGADADSTSLIYVLGPQPAHGSVVLTDAQTGDFTYTPTTNYAGTDTFTYTVSDGSLTSSAATVTITIAPVNDVPSFVPGGNITAVSNGQAATVAGWASSISHGGGVDEASQVVTFTVSANLTNAFTVQPTINAAGNLNYTAVAHYTGPVVLTIRAHDDGGQANGGVDASGAVTMTLTLDGTAVPPVVAPVTVATLLGLTVSVTPTYSAAGGGVTFSALTACSLGQVSIDSSTGVVTLVPERAGVETLTARATNAAGSTDYTITIAISDPTAAGVNRPRIITAPDEEAVVAGNTWSYTLTVSSASIAPGSQLSGLVSGASGATITRTQANEFQVQVPTAIGDAYKRIHIVVFDDATRSADAQLVIIRATAIAGGG
jgi:hypothetical protein